MISEVVLPNMPLQHSNSIHEIFLLNSITSKLLPIQRSKAKSLHKFVTPSNYISLPAYQHNTNERTYTVHKQGTHAQTCKHVYTGIVHMVHC